MLIYPVASSTAVCEDPYGENTCDRWASAIVSYDALDREVGGESTTHPKREKDVPSCSGGHAGEWSSSTSRVQQSCWKDGKTTTLVRSML